MATELQLLANRRNASSIEYPESRIQHPASSNENRAKSDEVMQIKPNFKKAKNERK